MTEGTEELAAYETAEAAWGHSEPKPERWSRGSWSVERRGDELADISFGGTRVLRMIRAVVRDRDWNTVPVEVTSVTDAVAGLELGLRFEGFGARFQGTLTIAGTEQELEVRLELEALADFDRNRIGLVVLHPPEVAGERLTVISPSMKRTETSFPARIAPHQPALDIAGLDWTADGVASSLRFAGDVFEMEDQRNWTDASFKTYSTPLSLPFPVRVRAGERIRQGIVLRAARVEAQRPQPMATPVTVRVAGGTLPEFVIGASTAAGTVPDAARTAPGSAVLVELVVGSANWRAALKRAVDEAGGRPLDVRIVAESAGEVETALDALAGTTEVIRLGAFSPTSQITEASLWTALRGGASRRAMSADLVGGARSHFTELNRRHQDLPDGIPALTFSITPQMHATERAQLVESIAMQRLVAENALRIAAGRPVHIGPVTLRPRYNAVATTAPPTDGDASVARGYGAEHVPGATDPRQRSRAAAAWTVASAAALSVAGVASIAFFESWGPRGVLDDAGTPYPVADALSAISGLAGHPRLDVTGLPSGIWALGARTPVADVVILANLRSSAVRLNVEGATGVELGPFAFTRLALRE